MGLGTSIVRRPGLETTGMVSDLIKQWSARREMRRRLRKLSFPLKRPIIKVGHGTYFNHARVYAWHETDVLEVGAYCSVADDVVFLLGGEHYKEHVTTWPWYDELVDARADGAIKNTSKGRVKVEHDVWIGHGAIILSGVTLSTGTIVGAGAVVTKPTLPYSIVAGNPARIINYRFDETTIQCLLESAWWRLPPERLAQFTEVLGDPQAFCERLRQLP